MSQGFLPRLDSWLRHAAPLAVTFMIVLLSVMPLPLPGYVAVAPRLVLMAVFYWSVHRPDLMRSASVFAIGLLEDILSGSPIGLNALVLLLVHGAIMNQYRVFRGQPFIVVWFAFMVIALAAMAVAAVVGFLVRGAPVDGGAFLTQLGLTVAVYPMVGWLLGRTQRAFLPAH